MAHAYGSIGLDRYAVQIDAGGHKIVADEPRSNGGADAGPAPYDLLLMSLAACTTITLRMYADRKQWEMSTLGVELRFTRGEDGKEHIDRTLRPEGKLTEDQLTRLLEIVERTPVTLTLKNGLSIVTSLATLDRSETM